ncbi:MAG: LOG family protein [Candidatus Promineifilaceae bacterium]
MSTPIPPNNRPVIAVFGSSAPEEGQPDYEAARKVGRLLAEAGFAVATGGYTGTMMAVSQGASVAGGHVIGVTCSQIEQFRPLGPNRWLTEEIRYATLRERLIHLVEHNDGIIVLPGGIGTLSEMALAWSLIQVEEIPARPLILMGQMWQDTINAFIQASYVYEIHQNLIKVALTPEEAIETLKREFEIKK